jgi:N-acetyl-alpha-D-muramate 1-phosphate uridylyltransferase
MSRLSVAILAGGLATRLGALTRESPKCLLEVAGRPFIHHQLALLRHHGVAKVVLCIGNQGNRVVEMVGDGESFGMQIVYSFDGPELKGTAGALKRALPLLGSPFFVLYGDSYLECDYKAIQEAHEAAGKLSLMTVFRNDGAWDTSNVEFDDGQIFAYDKFSRSERMRHIDYGLGIFDRRAFEAVPDSGLADLAPVYQRLLGLGQLAGYEVNQRFYEIGSVAGLEETRKFLSQREGVAAENVGSGHDARMAVLN